MYVRRLSLGLALLLIPPSAHAKLLAPLEVSAKQKINYRNGKNQVKLTWKANAASDPNNEVWIQKSFPKHKPAIVKKVIVLQGSVTEFLDEQSDCTDYYSKNNICNELVVGASYTYKVLHVSKTFNAKTQKFVYKKAGAKSVALTMSADWSPAIDHRAVYSKLSPNIGGPNLYTDKVSLVFGTVSALFIDQPVIYRPNETSPFQFGGKIEFLFFEEDGHGIRRVDFGPETLAGGRTLLDAPMYATMEPAGGGLIDCKGGQLSVDAFTAATSLGNGKFQLTNQQIQMGQPGPKGAGYFSAMIRYSERNMPVDPTRVVYTTGRSQLTINNANLEGLVLKANQNSNPAMHVFGKPFNCDNLADQQQLQLVGTAPSFSTDILKDVAVTIKLDF